MDGQALQWNPGGLLFASFGFLITFLHPFQDAVLVFLALHVLNMYIHPFSNDLEPNLLIYNDALGMLSDEDSSGFAVLTLMGEIPLGTEPVALMCILIYVAKGAAPCFLKGLEHM